MTIYTNKIGYNTHYNHIQDSLVGSPPKAITEMKLDYQFHRNRSDEQYRLDHTASN